MIDISSADMERLAELLGKELKLYEQIREMTEKQTEILAKDDIDAFEGSLDKRAELIEKIKGLHQETEPLMQSYVSSAAGVGKSESDNITTLKEQIRAALEECNTLNNQNIATMHEKTEQHTKKIDEHSAKRKGIGGYAQSVPNTPEMFDKKT